jgi:hypothetical protein
MTVLPLPRQPFFSYLLGLDDRWRHLIGPQRRSRFGNHKIHDFSDTGTLFDVVR